MGSVRRKGGAVRVELDDSEAGVLTSLVGQVRQLLTEGLADGPVDPLQALTGIGSGEVTAPEDPILVRLLPDAYRDDDEAAGEYRRLMDAELRLAKSSALQRVLDDLAAAAPVKKGDVRVELAEEAAEQWLYALNDVRLALGTAIGVTEEMDVARELADPDSPHAVTLPIYDWLTWLQDALVGAVTT